MNFGMLLTPAKFLVCVDVLSVPLLAFVPVEVPHPDNMTTVPATRAPKIARKFLCDFNAHLLPDFRLIILAGRLGIMGLF